MITEHLMRPGNGTLRFDPQVPVSVTNQISEWVDEQAGGPGAHIVVTPVRLDVATVGLDAILAVALYTGAITARPSRTSLEFTGLGSWLDTYLDADASRTSGTPTQWVGDLVANGLTAGTAAGGGSNVTRTFPAHAATHRQALDAVASSGGWEYEILPDFSIDFGTTANLFRQAGDDGTVVVTAREEGPDGTYRGVEGGLLDQKLTRLGPSIATKAVALAEGTGTGIAKGTATSSRNLKTWDGSTPTVVSVFSTPTEPTASADTAATNFLALQTMRRQMSVSSTTAGVRRLIRPGDEVYAYQLDSGIWEVANKIVFRGEVITPALVRLLSLSWPIDDQYGVYVFDNAASPTVIDVTRWIESEGPGAFWTVGDWSPPRFGGVNRTAPEIEERVAGGIVATKTTTTGISAGTGWSVDSYVSWRQGDWLQFRIGVTRTGSAVSNTASGNIGNQTVATLPSSERGSIAYNLPLAGGAPSGRLVAASYTPSSGVIQITALGGTSDFATSESVDLGGFLYLG